MFAQGSSGLGTSQSTPPSEMRYGLCPSDVEALTNFAITPGSSAG
ncbi:MAG: hypothetical protein R3B49_08730 [Phycisphaerales bacterium]